MTMRRICASTAPKILLARLPASDEFAYDTYNDEVPTGKSPRTYAQPDVAKPLLVAPLNPVPPFEVTTVNVPTAAPAGRL